MVENQTKRKLNSISSDVLEWMLAIDFDAFEFRRSRKNILENYVQILNKRNFSVKRVSDFTAFLYLGELVEYGDTRSIFEGPKNELTEKYITGKFG
jgi:hypothetical protein